MQIMLGLLLFIGVIIMVSLLFIGYLLHTNGKRTADINKVLDSKEADLIDLYESLEMMMEEIEQFTKKSKEEIQDEIEKFKYKQDEKVVTSPLDIETETETENEKEKEVILNSQMQLEREKLLGRYEKCIDLKATKVRSFYNRGYDVEDIAREMGIGKGEVQLILNIKNKII